MCNSGSERLNTSDLHRHQARRWHTNVSVGKAHIIHKYENIHKYFINLKKEAGVPKKFCMKFPLGPGDTAQNSCHTGRST